MAANIFYILIFTAMVGSIFTVCLWFVRKIFHFHVPICFDLCGLVLYFIPIVWPWNMLFSPEETLWVDGYRALCGLWLGGAGLLFLCYVLRTLLAYKVLKHCRHCENAPISSLYARCAEQAGLKKMPALYCGTLRQAACAAGVLSPKIILDASIAEQLTEGELTVVLFHELMHIKRRHLLFRRLYDVAGIFLWFTPFFWIGRNEFAVQCEIDCDRQALRALKGAVTNLDYAAAMLRVLELAARGTKRSSHTVGALGFLQTKQRMQLLFRIPSKVRQTVAAVVILLFLLGAAAFSVHASKSYFYPYYAGENAALETNVILRN